MHHVVTLFVMVILTGCTKGIDPKSTESFSVFGVTQISMIQSI